MAKKSPWTEIKKKYRISTTRKLNQIKEKFSTPEDFEEAVAEHPYEMLILYLEKTFSLADKMVIDLFPDLKNTVDRCTWVCWYILKQNESKGNTRMNANTLAKEVYQNYIEVKDFVVEAVTSSPMFFFDSKTKNVSIKDTYYKEANIAKVLKNKINNPHVYKDIHWEKYTTVDGFTLTDEQKQVLELVCENDVVMLNGSAGTGKSSAMKALVRMIEREGYSCTIVAPTGIAAKRISEVTGHNASTIHRFVLSPNSICGDFLIIDEMSMVGVGLLGSLFTKVEESTKIIFICDEAQLASISCGNIVQDIIDSGVMKTVNLTKVFRYGVGGIATVATDVRMGKPLEKDVKYNDYEFVSTTRHPLNDIMSVYDKLRESYDQNEIMILSPFNVREAGTFAINDAVQNKYNENDVVFSYDFKTAVNGKVNFKIGDKVVNTKNNYKITDKYNEPVPIMNGDIGEIIDYDPYEYNMFVQFDNGVACLESADIRELLLGYSITVHKSQGSQAKAVIVIADKSHGFFLTRNLLYVALSRAQEKLILIGDMPTINEALKVEENKIRNTWLKEMLIA